MFLLRGRVVEGVSHASYISGSGGVEFGVFLVVEQLQHHGRHVGEEGEESEHAPHEGDRLVLHAHQDEAAEPEQPHHLQVQL